MSGLTDEERELKRLAEAATPGPWQVDGAISVMGDVKPETWEEVCLTGDFMQSDEGEKKAQNEANARFIASFNPATALALLERVRKAEAKVADLQREHEEDQGVIRVWRGRTERAEAALLCEHGAEKDYCAASHNAAVDAAKRAGLETALRLAEDVEREEGEQGRTGPASGAGEVKDRIKERIRWLDEGQS